jgi:hypothetical protein
VQRLSLMLNTFAQSGLRALVRVAFGCERCGKRGDAAILSTMQPVIVAAWDELWTM